MKKPKVPLTQERVRELFDYDPETGIMRWRVSNSNVVRVGDAAGSRTTKGYLTVKIDSRTFFVHRVVWLWVHGYSPENGIDHINRVRTDNRLLNLREVSASCNTRNSKVKCLNASGVKGVNRYTAYDVWRVQISSNGKQQHLGVYRDFINAVAARLAGEQCLDYPNCDSSSSAYQHMQKYLKGEV